MDAKNKKGLIVVGSLLVVGVVGYFVYKKMSKKNEATATEGETTADTGSSTSSSTSVKKPSTGDKPSNTGVVPPAMQPTVKAVKGATIYIAKTDSSKGTYPAKVSRTTTQNEEVGSFIGYRLYNGSSYVLFKDRLNSGIQSLVLKSKTNLANA